MRAPEPLWGVRVAAPAKDLNGIGADGEIVLRFAPDEAFVLLEDTSVPGLEPGIGELDFGFVGWWLTTEEVTSHVLPHVDWPLPSERPALAQGLVAGVPAKLWLAEDRALLLCTAAYAHELEERLP